MPHYGAVECKVRPGRILLIPDRVSRAKVLILPG